jgi:hypothetical protein
METLKVKVLNLQNMGDSPKALTAIGATFIKQEVIQCKVESHHFMVDTFKGLLAIVKVEHGRVLAKSAIVAKAWKQVVARVEVWKR